MARDGDSFEVVTPAMIAAGVELFKQMRVGLSNASVVERIYRAIRAARGYLYFDPQMRSPSAEACGKRLERSKKRLKQKHRQNPSSV